jgi:hypothetical protein
MVAGRAALSPDLKFERDKLLFSLNNEFDLGISVDERKLFVQLFGARRQPAGDFHD